MLRGPTATAWLTWKFFIEGSSYRKIALRLSRAAAALVVRGEPIRRGEFRVRLHLGSEAVEHVLTLQTLEILLAELGQRFTHFADFLLLRVLLGIVEVLGIAEHAQHFAQSIGIDAVFERFADLRFQVPKLALGLLGLRVNGGVIIESFCFHRSLLVKRF